MESSRKIVNNILNQGICEAASAIVVIINRHQRQSQPAQKDHITYINLKNPRGNKSSAEATKQTEVERPRSLKYIGNRKSFVKEQISKNMSARRGL